MGLLPAAAHSFLHLNSCAMAVPDSRMRLPKVKPLESQPVFFGRVLFEDCDDLERVALLLLSVAKMFHLIRALEVVKN